MRVRHPALDAYNHVATAPKGKKDVGAAGGAAGNARARATSPDAASTSFSSEATELARTRLRAIEDGVDLARVAALKAKVERGDFKVDAVKIAEGLLDEMA
jgi:flagellar biosynthesis anti-sigma factor FlgM